MRTFRKALVFVLLNAAIMWTLHVMLAQPPMTGALLAEAKNLSYDTLILGQSHGEMGLDPFVLSECSDGNAFNLSKAYMPVADLYYMLTEANAGGQYKRVILNIDTTYWLSDFEGHSGYGDNLIPWLTGSRRLDYLRNVLGPSNYNETIADYQLNKVTVSAIPTNLKARFSAVGQETNEERLERMHSAITRSGISVYKGRGFKYGVKKSGIEWPPWNFDTDKVREGNIRTFKRIVKYCERRGIDFVCVQCALPPYRLLHENLDDVHDFFEGLCGKYDVPFYDMNYLKKGYLDRTDDDYVDLDGHMMGELAGRHTAVLADVLNSKDKDDFFYHSYDEVVENLEDKER